MIIADGPVDTETAPRRPKVVTYGVPYLALAWTGGWVGIASTGFFGSELWQPALWTACGYVMLYFVWRGNPQTVRFVALVTSYFSVTIVGVPLLIVLAVGDVDRMSQYLASPYGLIGIGAYLGTVLVGICLQRKPVRTWALVLHPPETRAEEALRREPVTVGGRRRPVLRRVVTEAGATRDKSHALREPAPLRDVPVTLDLGAALRRQAKVRVVVFAGVLCLIPVLLAERMTDESTLGGDAVSVFGAIGLAVVLVAALLVSLVRFRRRLGVGSVLTIDQGGLTWVSGTERAEFSWNGLAGVGISYRMAWRRRGKVMHMPQLEIFEQVASPPGRWPLLDTRRRREDPPRPNLPEERYRLMLPTDDETHRRIEAAVAEHREGLWLGWYERRRSDTPWFLR